MLILGPVVLLKVHELAELIQEPAEQRQTVRELAGLIPGRVVQIQVLEVRRQTVRGQAEHEQAAQIQELEVRIQGSGVLILTELAMAGLIQGPVEGH